MDQRPSGFRAIDAGMDGDRARRCRDLRQLAGIVIDEYDRFRAYSELKSDAIKRRGLVAPRRFDHRKIVESQREVDAPREKLFDIRPLVSCNERQQDSACSQLAQTSVQRDMAVANFNARWTVLAKDAAVERSIEIDCNGFNRRDRRCRQPATCELARDLHARSIAEPRAADRHRSTVEPPFCELVRERLQIGHVGRRKRTFCNSFAFG